VLSRIVGKVKDGDAGALRAKVRSLDKIADLIVIDTPSRWRYVLGRPGANCRRGPQFKAKDFKEFIRISGMTHV
jgi:hypothetical protein